MGLENRNIGKCYELNYNFILSHSDWQLVHGVISSYKMSNLSIYHAWGIKDDMIYDAVMKKEYPVIVYNALFNAQADYAYTWEQVLDMVNKYGHYGYWEEPRIRATQDKYYDKNGHIKEEYRKELFE